MSPGDAGTRATWWRNPALVLGVLLSVLALVQSHHHARKGRGAFLRWESADAALWAGEELYSSGSEEGYPTLPVTLVLMSPFRAVGPVAGSVLWAAFKIGLSWWLLARVLALAAGRERSLPTWAQLAILLLSFRPILSDILHGNINVPVAAVVVAGAWSWQRGRPLAAGAWLGFGAALKVTPALGLLLFLVRRDRAAGLGLAGFALGAAAGALGPALVLGLSRTVELDVAWWHQMVEPYVRGRELTLTQTQHVNQSLLGVLSRHLTDAVAIEADPPGFPDDVRIGWMDLDARAFRGVHLAACLAVLALVAWCLRPARGRDAGPGDGRTVLGQFSLLALAMLALSERSWKHHHALLALPVAFLVAQLVARRDRACSRVAVAGLVLSALLHGATGSALLGSEGSDLAEAYGVYLVGDLVLLVSVAWCLRRRGRAPS